MIHILIESRTQINEGNKKIPVYASEWDFI